MNWSPTLEKDLLEYIKTRDEKLFNDKIYNPLRYYITWAIEKYAGNYHEYAEYDDVVNECFDQIFIYLFDFNPDKGMTIQSWVHLMLKTRLRGLYHFNTLQKRDYKNKVSLDYLLSEEKD